MAPPTPVADRSQPAVSSRRWPWWLAGALLAAHVALAWTGVAGKSVTADEILHVTGGTLFNRLADYRIHPENGILPQRLHGLPAVLMGARLPPFAGNEYWQAADGAVVGHQFFYEAGNDHRLLLREARRLNLLFSVGLCGVVWWWARRWGGEVAGLTALALAAFSPTVLAHGPLATSDAAAACLLPASAGLFWWQLRAGGTGRLAVSATVFGLACVAKFSAVLLLPVLLLLAAGHARQGGRGAAARAAGTLAVHGLAAWAVIWAFFGFRFAALAPEWADGGQMVRSWEWMLGRLGWQAPVVAWGREWRVLPEGFLYGYAHANVAAQARSAFLAGDYSLTGWGSFFPLAFLWKSTPAELAAAALAAVGAGLTVWRARVGRRWSGAALPLLCWAVVYGGAALTSRLNIGHRHLLPLYPVLFVGAGVALARAAHGARAGWGGAMVLGSAQLVSATMIHPDYLAYFNRFAGGPANGWRLLVDSSLDWGQDLPGIRGWLDRHNAGPEAQPVFLAYFGSGEPTDERIGAVWLPFVNGFKQPHAWYEPKAGIYTISATMLQQVYSPFHGEWTEKFEQEYQRLWAREPEFRTGSVADGGARGPEGEAQRQRAAAWQRYDLLRFARLCHYLRAGEPAAMVGYSILIYRLSAAEVAEALESDLAGWRRAVARRAAGG